MYNNGWNTELVFILDRKPPVTHSSDLKPGKPTSLGMCPSLYTIVTCLLTLFTPFIFFTPTFDLDPALSNVATFAADWATIQQTLYLLSIAVDTKDYALLNDIFTPTTTGIFSNPSLQDFSGFPAITALLSKG